MAMIGVIREALHDVDPRLPLMNARTVESVVEDSLAATSLLRSVMGQGLKLTSLGVLLGLLASWGVSRALASLLYGVRATDPMTFLGTAGLITLVATLATWIPARRASKVDPVEALRSE